ncbi:MAG: hypothetical protein AB8H79_00110 [Myxococcota bacterium]
MKHLALLLAMTSGPAWAGEADDTDSATTDSAPLAVPANTVQIPYRNAAGQLPAQGYRYIRPQPPMRRFRGPKWLQRALAVPDPPQERPELDPYAPTGAVVEPTITARSIPEPGPRPEAYADEEIVVWGDRLEQARAAVDRRMRSLGYEVANSKKGRTTWKPSGAYAGWKPTVTIDDDGWFDVKAPAVSGLTPTATAGQLGPTAPVGADTQTSNQLPPVLGGGITGQVSGKRVRMHAENKVSRQVWDVVAGLSEAHSETSLIARLEQLPDELDALWHQGVGPGGALYVTNQERQSALLTLWASRTPTRTGETVRNKIADYLLNEVHPEATLPPSMVAKAERRCGCLLFR